MCNIKQKNKKSIYRIKKRDDTNKMIDYYQTIIKPGLSESEKVLFKEFWPNYSFEKKEKTYADAIKNNNQDWIKFYNYTCK